jgi:multidrug efflux pump subunit AcrA (membrane-fusion protein)
MTENSGFKRQVRARMAITGEAYSLARRAIQNANGAVSQQELERLIADIQEFLAGRGRVMVPHGFTVESVKDDTAVVRIPVIWKPRKDMIIALASDTPATKNVDELRSLFERGLGSGEYLPNARLADWDAVIEDGPRPGKLDWTVRIRASV